MAENSSTVKDDVLARYREGEPLLRLAAGTSLRANSLLKYLVPAGLVRAPSREERFLMAACSQRMATGGQRYRTLEAFQRQLASDGLTLWTYALYYQIAIRPLVSFFLDGGQQPQEVRLLLEKIALDYPDLHGDMLLLTGELAGDRQAAGATPRAVHSAHHELVNLRREGIGLMQACQRCRITAETAMRYLREAGEIPALGRSAATATATLRKQPGLFPVLSSMDEHLRSLKITLAIYCSYYGLELHRIIEDLKAGEAAAAADLGQRFAADTGSAAPAPAPPPDAGVIEVMRGPGGYVATFHGMSFSGATPVAAVSRLEQAAAAAAGLVAKGGQQCPE